MKSKRKFLVDGMDRDLLRFLYKNKNPANQQQIARNIGLSPSAIKSRLDKLKKQGIVKPTKISGIRTFERNFGSKKVKIKSPRSIYWDLDIVDDLKKEKRDFFKS